MELTLEKEEPEEMVVAVEMEVVATKKAMTVVAVEMETVATKKATAVVIAMEVVVKVAKLELLGDRSRFSQK